MSDLKIFRSFKAKVKICSTFLKSVIKKKKKKPHDEQNQNPNFPPSFQDKEIIKFGNLGWNPDSSPIGICTILRKLLFSSSKSGSNTYLLELL